MGSLTNFGEILSLIYLLGKNTDLQVLNTTLFAAASTSETTIGAWVGLSNLDPALDNSPEQGFNEVASQTGGTSGYRRQLATFAQPTYGSVESDFRIEATNTNIITFSAINGNIGTFRYITIHYTSDLNNTELFYFELPQPVTISSGESYTIPVGALKCTLSEHVDYNDSFTLTAKRVILDKLLTIQNAESAQRASALGFRFGEFTNSAIILVILATDETVPREGRETPPQTYTPGQISTAQQITFDFQELIARIRNFTGAARVGNRDTITFDLTDQLAEFLTIPYISIVYNLAAAGETGGPVIATLRLDSPVTFAPGRQVVFQPQAIGLSFT